MRRRLGTLALAVLACGFQAARAGADAPGDADRKFIAEAVLGEYVDLKYWQRMWIDEAEVHKVAFERKLRSNDPVEQLKTQQAMQQALALGPDASEANLRARLKALRDGGVEIKCRSNRMQFVAASAARRVAVIRYPNPVADQVLDMQLVRLDRWAATYLAFRSRELERAGVLPFWDDKEAEAAKALALDELPFNASNIVYRVSSQRRPAFDWCAK